MHVSHPRLTALATGAPEHTVPQRAVKRFAANMFANTIGGDSRLLDIFDNAEIEERRLCVGLDWLTADHSFQEKNDLYVKHATQLAVSVARDALRRARLTADDIDHIVFISSTGLATPSLDALIANELACRAAVRRTPVWGLGCAGGAAGLALARDFALADPSARVLLIALELCSLTFQRSDLTRRNLVAAALFGDGAAAAIVAGADAARAMRDTGTALDLVASQSTLWRNTTDVMGWTVDGDGLHVVFSQDIPSIVRERVQPGLASFLAAQGLSVETLAHLVTHPGGVKVLRAYADALGVAPARFDHARHVLRRFGNMSSPSCLFVLERFLDSGDIRPGDNVVVAALGPGFSAEYVLLRGGES